MTGLFILLRGERLFRLNKCRVCVQISLHWLEKDLIEEMKWCLVGMWDTKLIHCMSSFVVSCHDVLAAYPMCVYRTRNAFCNTVAVFHPPPKPSAKMCKEEAVSYNPKSGSWSESFLQAAYPPHFYCSQQTRWYSCDVPTRRQIIPNKIFPLCLRPNVFSRNCD